MNDEQKRERIATLRATAADLRLCAHYAERYEQSFAERQRAAQLEQQARELEAQLQAV